MATNRWTMLGAFALVLALAGCGGDDDAGGLDVLDQIGSEANSGGGADAGSEAGSGDAGATDAGAGDEARSAEQLVEDAKESAEDFVAAFNEGGSATVEFDGQTIEFAAELCFAGQGALTFEGGGTAADGTPVWLSVDHTSESREEVLGYLDEALVNSLYGDADPIVNDSVTLDFGRTEMFAGAPDDQPSLNATTELGDGDLVVVVSDSGLTGSGSASDFNYVLSDDFNETFPIAYEVSCG